MLTIQKVWKIVWGEKTPLALAVVAQASAVGIYMSATAATSIIWFNLIIAVVASFALDLIIVSTAFHEKRSLQAWIFAALTSLAALGFSIGIALAVFRGDYLHAAYPTIVFLYSWFLSITKADSAIESGDTALIQLDTERYKNHIIRNLIRFGLNNTQIYDIVGGNRNKCIQLINTLRDELNTAKNEQGTEENTTDT